MSCLNFYCVSLVDVLILNAAYSSLIGSIPTCRHIRQWAHIHYPKSTTNINSPHQTVIMIQQSNIRLAVGHVICCVIALWHCKNILEAAVTPHLLFFVLYWWQSTMEDSIEVILQDYGGDLHTNRTNPVLSACTGALLAGLYGVWRLFTMPGFRKIPRSLKVLKNSFLFLFFTCLLCLLFSFKYQMLHVCMKSKKRSRDGT